MLSSKPRKYLGIATSRIGRAIAFAVFACIVLVEMVILVPSAMRFEQEQIRQLNDAEYGKLVAAIEASQSGLETLHLDSVGKIQGLTVFSIGGAMLYQAGDAPDDRPSEQEVGQPPKFNGLVAETTWKLVEHGMPVLIRARLDASSIKPALHAYILRIIGLVIIISAVVTLGALVVTHRVVLTPLYSVIEAMKGNRQEQRRNRLSWLREDELAVLVDEYNNLIDAQDESERKAQIKQKHLEYMALHDSLTNLPNRTAFANELTDQIEGHPTQRLAVMLVDLDRFKRFNDLHGERIGDSVLADSARRVQNFAGYSGFAARLEGDELALFLPIGMDEDLSEYASVLLRSLEEPHYIHGMRFDIRASVGISCYPDFAKDVSGLLGQFNMALDEAKLLGRGRWCLYDDNIRQRITQREALEADIKQALIEEQFSVFYQPKIDISSQQVIGVEALVRWQHPKRGNVPPDQFIPLSEECGLVVPLGEWVLETACLAAKRWHDMGLPRMTVAVNISAAQMQSHMLFDTVRIALATSQLPAELLELEITESAMMDDPAEVITLLDRLHDLGVSLAIDDFGTGYSSLTYLKRFPVDTLKIDKAFVQDVTEDRDDAAIVGAVLELGRHFSLKVVAEGVENDEQMSFLADHGCDVAQGYFISRPLPGDELINWLREHEAALRPRQFSGQSAEGQRHS